MPVYLLTLHAYRSWREDDPRGYVQRGKAGVQKPNAGLARYRDSTAKQPPAGFDAHDLIIGAVRDVCGHRDWRPHGVSVTPTHVHVLVSWRGDAEARDVAATLKRIVGLRLSKAAGQVGRRWFSRGSDETRVRDPQHFEFLLEIYLPKHVNEGGKYWREDV